jgi:hypothetical protein
MLRIVQVIVTSYLFPNGNFDEERLKRISQSVGKDRLVVDVRYVAGLAHLSSLTRGC